ncbi:MAG TPA: hypothetical protein VD695_01925 [Gaiellaceae bacterium]|nr:hypothetical protein [Gaiellaceae bacterium]
MPSVTPPPATAPPPTRRQRQTREKKRPPAATARKVRSADRVYSTPIHLTRAEAGTVLADSTPALRSEAASAPAVPAALVRATGGRSPSAAEAALLLLLGGTVLALVFAAVPARTLATVSPRLVERRADIGLAMAAVAVAVGAGILVVLVGT